jgi:hypothetical protein
MAQAIIAVLGLVGLASFFGARLYIAWRDKSAHLATFDIPIKTQSVLF